MRQIVEKFFCDLCKRECAEKALQSFSYPVIFYTDQTEGKLCEPYVSHTKLEVCQKCCGKILKVSATGAQGYNEYTIVGEEE